MGDHVSGGSIFSLDPGHPILSIIVSSPYSHHLCEHRNLHPVVQLKLLPCQCHGFNAPSHDLEARPLPDVDALA